MHPSVPPAPATAEVFFAAASPSTAGEPAAPKEQEVTAEQKIAGPAAYEQQFTRSVVAVYRPDQCMPSKAEAQPSARAVLLSTRQ